MRGRKTNPTSQRQVHQAAKMKRTQPATSDIEPHFKPANLSDIRAIDQASKKFADRYAPLLRDRGVLTDVDLAMFELLSWAFAIVEVAGRHLLKEGLLVKHSHGATRKSPYYFAFRDGSKMFLSLACEFGMTPASRARVMRSRKPPSSRKSFSRRRI